MSAVRRDVVGKWALALLGAGVLIAGVFCARGLLPGDRAIATSDVKKKLEGGRIKLSAKEADLNIRVEKIKDIDWVPKLPVYGRVVNNPGATSELRAPWAGRLRGGDWPTIATQVKSGALLGQLEVRPPQDRLDLVAKLNEARLKLEGARKVWTYQQERVKRFESAPTSFARSELDAALVALADAETQVALNDAAARLWQEALTTLDNQGDLKQLTWTLPLRAPADGEIIELIGRPDTAVEAGSLIAKIVDFRRALVRIDIPLGWQTDPPQTLTITVLSPTPPGLDGPNNRSEPPAPVLALPGELVGVAGQVDPTGQATGYLYEVRDVVGAGKSTLSVKLLRPGLFVKAQLDVKAAVVSALAMPNSARIFHQGRALVYIELPAGAKGDNASRQAPRFFQRVEVNVLGSDGNTLVVAGNLVEGDQVVTDGALYLLSAEFRTDSDD